MPDGLITSAVLGITSSVSGRAWIWRNQPSDPEADRHGLAIAQSFDLPEIIGRLLAARGIERDGVADFLAPTLRRVLPDPSSLRDMDAAAARLADAVTRRETIGVFGDYDVDGACATALAADVLGRLGCRVVTHIPDRLAEGYGPNRSALARLAAEGASLILCVDCGTAAAEVLAAAAAEIIVLDHHKADIPPHGIVATVNPNRLDDRSGLGQLCAAGVVFLAMVATLRVLRERGRPDAVPSLAAPDLLGLLDIVALATICDVVPITGINRAFVAQGLRVMARRGRLGLAALLEVAAVRDAPSASTCGFALGPRINAGGRIGDAGLGVRLLLATDADEARRIALALDEVNRERQSVESAILERAISQAEAQLGRGHATIVLEGEGWHPGVVGILAGRLKQRFNRPACVGARADVLTRGSGRSVPGLDLGSAIIAARQAGLLLTGGGHAMAAGYGHAPGAAAALHAFLDERLSSAAVQPAQPHLRCEGTLAPAAATLDLARQIGRLAPFGNGNEEPVFVLTRARVVRADRIGQEGRTLRAILEGEGGIGRVKSILFRAGEDNPVARLLQMPGAPPLHLAGHLRADRWQGAETVCFAIEDAAIA